MTAKVVVIIIALINPSEKEVLETYLGEMKQLYAEVEDTRLMQDEIIYQLQTYQKSASVFINQNGEHPFVKKLSDTLDIFAKTPRPETPKTLKDYWSALAKAN